MRDKENIPKEKEYIALDDQLSVFAGYKEGLGVNYFKQQELGEKNGEYLISKITNSNTITLIFILQIWMF